MLRNTQNGNSVFVFALLGGSVVLFAVALFLLLKLPAYRILDTAKADPKPGAIAESQPEVKAEPQPEAKVELKTEATTESQSEDEAVIQPEANTDVATLMNTKLGDLLLASLLKDPDSAGRIVAQAIIQAEASTNEEEVSRPEAELKPEAKP